jgi:DNA invertase Pin-like site-specific DNA recombinase
MLKDVKHNKTWRGLVVFKFDRLSRNLEDFIKLEKILKDHNMDLVSVAEPMLNNYLGKYMVRDMQNRAILYSEELSFRVKLGFRKKMQMGGYIGGKAPYGLKCVNGYILPDDDKAEVVSFVFENYATGYFGFRVLAKLVRQTFKLKNFTHARVEHIIDSSMYCGYKTKERNLSNSEYVFWGYDKP